MTNYILILGARSDMARAAAKVFAQNGFNLFLAARNLEEVKADAKDLEIRYKIKATAIEYDALEFDHHPALYAALNPKPDVVLQAIGFDGPQEEAEKDPVLARKIMATNYLGAASMLDIAANDMLSRGSGTIIGISSVAGDRGRAKNYFYGSAKAGFSAYLSGLRNRLGKTSIHVMTVKPGFAATKMTEGLALPGPLTASPEKIAQDIWNGFKKRKNIIYTLWMWRWIMLIITSIPEGIFKKMKL